MFSRKNRYLLSVLSGILMVISFPFSGSLSFLAFLSWVPILLVEDTIFRSRYKSGKVFIHAYIAFFIYNVGTTWWIYFASPGGAYLAFILNSLLMALTFYLYHLIRKAIDKKVSLAILLLLWIGFEHFHFHWELSWPWLTLGNVFSRNPEFIQWYEYTGAMGGSMWILICNFLVFLFISRWIKIRKAVFKEQRTLIFVIPLIVFIPILFSWVMYSRYTEQINPVEIVVVQPNIDPYNEKFVSNADDQIKSMLEIAKKKISSKTKFVLFPETAISAAFFS
jgi:apolipoprotein N-acyltransferase